jgi:hypothetical protein
MAVYMEEGADVTLQVAVVVLSHSPPFFFLTSILPPPSQDNAARQTNVSPYPPSFLVTLFWSVLRFLSLAHRVSLVRYLNVLNNTIGMPRGSDGHPVI